MRWASGRAALAASGGHHAALSGEPARLHDISILIHCAVSALESGAGMQATRQAVQFAWLRPAVALLGRRASLATSANCTTQRARHGAGSWRQARPLAAAAAAEEVPPPGAAATDGAPAKRAGKRKVALYLGYEGTAYRGAAARLPSRRPPAARLPMHEPCSSRGTTTALSHWHHTPACTPHPPSPAVATPCPAQACRCRA